MAAEDLFRAPPSSTPPSMVCVRSAAPYQDKHLTYSAFFGNSEGRDGVNLASRYSAFSANYETQIYHPYDETVSPAPSPTPEPKKHHRHYQ